MYVTRQTFCHQIFFPDLFVEETENWRRDPLSLHATHVSAELNQIKPTSEPNISAAHSPN